MVGECIDREATNTAHRRRQHTHRDDRHQRRYRGHISKRRANRFNGQQPKQLQ